ncbi:uncharacterized protein LOC142224666 [Haematobia irritans]|uniref:uncharacterized protein LOC142224666 n=1 Tax=Haematobia irritans TaxID=7368 RepID=UPI003F5037C6
MSKPESNTGGFPIDRLLGRENYPTWKIAAQAYLDLDNLWTTTIDYEVNEQGNPKKDVSPDQNRRARTLVTTAQSLNGIGFTISEEWVGSLLLAGLPDEYRPMFMGLENSGISITGDSIKVKLLQEYQVHAKHPHLKFHKESYNNTTNNNDWYFDSGATSHMTFNSDLLTNNNSKTGTVSTTNKGIMKIKASSTSTIRPDCHDTDIAINNVLHIPDLSTNLLSVSQIVKRSHCVIFSKSGVVVLNPDNKVISTGKHINGLFKLECKTTNKAFACGATASYNLWHRRMGHINLKSLQQLKNGLATGIEFSNDNANDCKICPMGKQIRLPFNKNAHRASEILELVHCDVCGPMEEHSLGESEVAAKFKEFLCFAERQSGEQLKTIRTDNGTESIVEKARCILADANLPKIFWAEAAAYSVYLLKRSPSKGTGITPEEAWNGRKPDLSHIKVFGRTAMVPSANRKKWDVKAKECVLVGFDEHTKCYRFYDPDKNMVFKSRNVSFIDENLSKDTPAKFAIKTKHSKVSLDLKENVLEEQSQTEIISRNEVAEQQQIEITPTDSTDDSLRRSGRNRKKPVRLYAYVTNNESASSSDEYETAVLRNDEQGDDNSTCNSEVNFIGFSGLAAPPSQPNSQKLFPQQKVKHGDEGRIFRGKYFETNFKNKQNTASHLFQTYMDDLATLEEALARPDANTWKLAMEEEYQSLMQNNTWSMSESTPKRQPNVNGFFELNVTSLVALIVIKREWL